MTGLVVVFVFAVAAVALAAVKSWRRCPVCGHTFGTNTAVVNHLRKAQLDWGTTARGTTACGYWRQVSGLVWQDADAVHPDDRCKRPGCAKAWSEYDQERS